MPRYQQVHILLMIFSSGIEESQIADIDSVVALWTDLSSCRFLDRAERQAMSAADVQNLLQGAAPGLGAQVRQLCRTLSAGFREEPVSICSAQL